MIARCTKQLNNYKSKLPLAETTEASTDATPDSQPESPEDLKDEREVGVPKSKLYTVKSAVWIVSEAA